MRVVKNTRPYQSLNVITYHFPFLNVQYKQPDSDSQRFKSGGLRKSLVEHKSPQSEVGSSSTYRECTCEKEIYAI